MTHEPWIAPGEPKGTVRLSVGIIVRNEQQTIGRMLASLFGQSLFQHLAKGYGVCEIICVANGCTDRTAEVAQEIFAEQTRSHPFRGTFRCRVEVLPRPGKLQAWNEYVHSLSAREAEYLFLADGDIVIHRPDTLWNMFLAVEQCPAATAVTDEPLKDIVFKSRKTWSEKLSLAASRMTRSQPAQLTGQLYGIRSEVARNMYLPRDLTACEDGLIKTLACTCFLTRPATSGRIVKAPNASHIFEPYMGLMEVLRNQKRQMIGQTIVHILVDQYLPGLRLEERLNLAETLQDKDRFDPDWLKKLVRTHLQGIRHFWQLFPGALSFRLARLGGIPGFRKVGHLPAALLGLAIAALSCWLSYRFLKKGVQAYWPDTHRRAVQGSAPVAAVKAACEVTT
jgi:hypothetical protein